MNGAEAAVPSITLCSIQIPQPPSSPTKTCDMKTGAGREERGIKEVGGGE